VVLVIIVITTIFVMGITIFDIFYDNRSQDCTKLYLTQGHYFILH
jgi:hypothetical protein